MIRADIAIEWELRGPFITQSSAPGAHGLDACLARDGDGRPYLPGTQVTGKLRQAWEELADALEGQGKSAAAVPGKDEIDALLGAAASDAERRPRPKRLLFTDFLLAGDPPGEGVRYRIRMDPERGAAEDRCQMLVENPFAAGESLRFVGKISFLAQDAVEAGKIREKVHCGLQWIDQMGAFRTQGFGQVRGVALAEPAIAEMRESKPSPVAETDEGFDLVIRPESPFCLDASGSATNLFASGEIIPGGVLLGCLARMFGLPEARETEDELAALRRNFEHLRLRHAFPSRACLTRPVALPLSLVQTSSRAYDVALERFPRLIDGDAPAFWVDWKDDSALRARFGWPGLERELRVRTAISSEKRRAEDERLFSYEMIRPGGHCWLSRVSLADVPEAERKEVASQLASLLGLGFMGLGKTKTIAAVTPLPAGQIQDALETTAIDRVLDEDGRIVLMLQTPALLLDPRGLDETAREPQLRRAYAETWGALSPHLRLKEFFARQRLAGGEYQAHRFGRQGADYYPWLLTEAGSVFVFSVIDQAGMRRDLERWLRGGLPLAEKIRDFYGLQGMRDAEGWKRCPYTPHNGYGEIAVNLEIHRTMRPPPNPRDAIAPIAPQEDL